MRGSTYFKAAVKYWRGSEDQLPDLFRAIRCFARARDLGVKKATSKLRQLILEISDDDENLIPLLREAARYKDGQACWNLGEHLSEGRNCRRNTEEAISFFIRAGEYCEEGISAVGRDLVIATEIFFTPSDHVEFFLFLVHPPPESGVSQAGLRAITTGIRLESSGASVLDTVDKNYQMHKLRKLSGVHGRVNIHEDTVHGAVLSLVVFRLNDQLFKTFGDYYLAV